MDPPTSQKKVYHNLSLAEAELLEKLVNDIKSLITLRGRKVFLRPRRGRPRLNPPYEAFPITRPSSIPKRRRLKLIRKQLLEKRIDRYRDVVNEYKQLLLRKLGGNPKLAMQKFMRNIKDITQFFQRLPTKVEEHLIRSPVLPSDFLDKPVSASLDKAIFFKEINKKLKHFEYSYLFDGREQDEIIRTTRRKHSFPEIIEALAEVFVERAIKAFSKRLKYDVFIAKKVKIGFYAFLRFSCVFASSDGEEITVYVTSLPHRRNEVFVNKISDVDVILRLLGKEVLIRIYEMNKGASGLNFVRVEVAKLELFYHDKPLINTEPVPLQAGKGWRELPEWIKDSKSIVNIQNNDDSCFK
jgi:hypothetical protein